MLLAKFEWLGLCRLLTLWTYAWRATLHTIIYFQILLTHILYSQIDMISLRYANSGPLVSKAFLQSFFISFTCFLIWLMSTMSSINYIHHGTSSLISVVMLFITNRNRLGHSASYKCKLKCCPLSSYTCNHLSLDVLYNFDITIMHLFFSTVFGIFSLLSKSLRSRLNKKMASVRKLPSIILKWNIWFLS